MNDSFGPPVPVIVIFSILVAISFFFQVNRDAALKRRWWPRFLIATAILFPVIGYLIGGVPMALFLLVGAVVFGRINLRRIRFCDSCGRTSNSVDFLNPPARYCPSCGATLV